MAEDLCPNSLFRAGRYFFCWVKKKKINWDPVPGGNLIRDTLASTHTPGLLISPFPSALSVYRLWKQCLSAAALLSVLVINFFGRRESALPLWGPKTHNKLNNPKGMSPGTTHFTQIPLLSKKRIKSQDSLVVQGLNKCNERCTKCVFKPHRADI